MELVCVYCQALKFRKEPIGMCCSKGIVYLEPLNQLPELLFSYLHGIKF